MMLTRLKSFIKQSDLVWIDHDSVTVEEEEKKKEEVQEREGERGK